MQHATDDLVDEQAADLAQAIAAGAVALDQAPGLQQCERGLQVGPLLGPCCRHLAGGPQLPGQAPQPVLGGFKQSGYRARPALGLKLGLELHALGIDDLPTVAIRVGAFADPEQRPLEQPPIAIALGLSAISPEPAYGSLLEFVLEQIAPCRH